MKSDRLTPTVLIVDDNLDNLGMLSNYLHTSGYEIMTARNGRDALAKVHRSPPDIVISDILLPKVDGYTLCRKMKSDDTLCTIPFVFYTANYTDSQDEALALSLGASRFIVKPIEMDQFLQIIEDVITKHRNRQLPTPKQPLLESEILERMHVDRLTAKLEQKLVALQEEHDALLESEQRFKDFAEIAADGFWEAAADLKLNFLSQRYESLNGTSLRKLLGNEAGKAGFAAGIQTRDTEDGGDLLEHRRPFSDVEVECDVLDGFVRTLRISGKPILGSDGSFRGYRGVCRDVTEAARITRKMVHQASHDVLTGLINRAEFEQRLERTVDNSRNSGSHHSLCYMDLDQFKVVNDTVGHVAGDEMLRQIARILNGKIRSRDTLARLGGDEFALILENCPLDKAKDIAQTLVDTLNDFRFVWQGQHFRGSISIGIAEIQPNLNSNTEILSRADTACYAAKEAGRNRVSLYHTDEENSIPPRTKTLRASEVSDLLKNGRFRLYVQPIVPLFHGSNILRYEVLIRMINKDDKAILPNSFISAAERYGIMKDIDRWVIQQSIQSYHHTLGQQCKASLFINLSGASVEDSSLPDFIGDVLQNAEIPANRICFEITETTAIVNLEQAVQFIESLRGLGCRFALDDFGYGACSFTYLKRLPVDFVKIYGGFIQDIENNLVDQAMVTAISQVARVMGIQTVAEWVERESILEFVRELDIDFAQGYALGKPCPIDILGGSRI